MHLGLRLTPRSGTVLGSEAEEAVLAEVVRRIRQTTRRANSLARVGSSAFCLLVPEADDEAAMIVAGNLAEALTESPFHIVAATSSVPVSVEVSALTATDPSEVELEAWWGGGAFPAGTSVIPRFTPDSNVIPLPSVYQAA